MSYEKQTWTNGEVITAEKLNHIEDGITELGGSNVFDCNITAERVNNEEPVVTSCDKTINELVAILNEKGSLKVKYEIDTTFTSGQPGYKTTCYFSECSYSDDYINTIEFGDSLYIDSQGAHAR